MNVELLKTLLAVPSQTGREEQMVAFLREYCERRGCLVQTDHLNNVVITRGATNNFPMVAAHIDTVQPVNRKIRVVQTDGVLHAVTDDNRPAGCGADCKTGILVCLELLDRFPNIKLGFFAGEESGCYGARELNRSWMADVGYVLEWDCPSRGMMSYTSSGSRLFDNRGSFIEKVLPVLDHYEVQWQHHPYTDVHVLSPRFQLSCLNLSSGYYNWHAETEYIQLDDVAVAINMGEVLLRKLGEEKYPFSGKCRRKPARAITRLDFSRVFPKELPF